MIYLVNVIERRLSTSPVPFHEGLFAQRMLSHLICLCLQTRKFTTCAVTSNSNPSDSPRPKQPRAKFPSAHSAATSVSVEILIVLIYQKGSSEVSRFIWLWRSIKKGDTDGDSGVQSTGAHVYCPIAASYKCSLKTEVAPNGACHRLLAFFLIRAYNIFCVPCFFRLPLCESRVGLGRTSCFMSRSHTAWEQRCSHDL